MLKLQRQQHAYTSTPSRSIAARMCGLAIVTSTRSSSIVGSFHAFSIHR